MARDPYRYFRIEARELLEQLGRGVLEVESAARQPELIPRLLRLAHTLKGAARVVKCRQIADGAHTLEDLLAAIRDGVSSEKAIDRMLMVLDELGAAVAALTPAPAEGAPDQAEASEELFRAFRPNVHEVDVLLDALGEAHSQLAAFGPLLHRIEKARHVADLLVDHLAAPTDREVSRVPARLGGQSTRAVAEELRAQFGGLERDFGSRIAFIGREFREARQAAERLRLVPASALFTLLRRTARDVANATGKKVVFEGKGGEVRVDVHVLGTLQAALLQLVRNAVAHGIESSANRTAAGKTSEGHVTVTVVRRGKEVRCACEDDGGGIDLDEVRRLARGKGLLTSQIDAARPDELLDLLLKGGLSTSGSVSEISGRGIGLDVVREAAAQLGGEVTARTEVGIGTTITITAPFILAALPVLQVESSGVTAFIPLDAVRGSLSFSADALVRTPLGQSVRFNDRAIPFGSLARAVSRESAENPTESSVVVIEGQGGTAGFGVDRIVGIADVILRPLPDGTPVASFVAGAALDEEGTPQLVLDPDALVAAAEGVLTRRDAPGRKRPAILVIDDSLTTRMLEQSILESAGYEVSVATSGEEGLAKARDGDYALFLVDVEMPGIDGFTFIERARNEAGLRHIPSILVTSRNSEEDRRRGHEAGARAYIVKSEFDQGVLLDRIEELVR